MKKYLPWAAIVALLIGLALLPGPKAGAETPTAPAITGSVACDHTSSTWTASFVITGTPGSGLFVYPFGGQPNAGTLTGMPNNQGIIGPNGTFTFGVVNIPKGTDHIQVDITVLYTGPDLFVSLPITGTCDPTPTTTTVPPTVPPVAPPPVVPPAAPVVPAPVVAPPAAVQAPLAFTGAPIWPEVGLALCLIALGLALVRRSVRHA